MPLYFRPIEGTEAEYTFEPHDDFKETYDSEEEDVGFYLRDDEVLVFEATGESAPYTYGGMAFPIAEGRLILRLEEWVACASVGEGTAHTIDNIIDEYLSD